MPTYKSKPQEKRFSASAAKRAVKFFSPLPQDAPPVTAPERCVETLILPCVADLDHYLLYGDE